jgi:hypothetical protein
MAVLQEIVAYLAAHPALLGCLALFAFLAIIGGWYVLSHHLGDLLTTVLCAGGFASGILVLYRGYTEGMRDLMGVGVFLMIVFPIIYQQGLKIARAYNGDAVARGHAKRAGA